MENVFHCRVGLAQLENLLNDVLDGNATLETIDLIEKTARVISNSADCAIGYEAANMVLKGVIGFRSDYVEHIINDRCICNLDQPVPCVALCPAGVDIPGYIALISEGKDMLMQFVLSERTIHSQLLVHLFVNIHVRLGVDVI